MAKYEINAAEKDAAPKITIGGQTFSIPLMAPRQNRKLVPAAAQFGTMLSGGVVDEDQFDRLLALVQVGISRAHPEITLDDLLDMPITLPEMVDALSVIFEQTGVLKVGKPAAGEATAGS